MMWKSGLGTRQSSGPIAHAGPSREGTECNRFEHHVTELRAYPSATPLFLCSNVGHRSTSCGLKHLYVQCHSYTVSINYRTEGVPVPSAHANRAQKLADRNLTLFDERICRMRNSGPKLVNHCASRMRLHTHYSAHLLIEENCG